jgi:outer membrane protein OmpA-like peptidoglycan-associated protein
VNVKAIFLLCGLLFFCPFFSPGQEASKRKMAFAVSHLSSENKGLLTRKGAPKHNLFTKLVCFKKACRRYVGWRKNHRKARFKGYKTGGKLPPRVQESEIEEHTPPMEALPQADSSVAAPVRTEQDLPETAPDQLIILDEVLFDINSAQLNPAFTFRLDSLTRILAKDVRLQVAISGHTDNVGPENHNRSLSNDRARAVATYLNANGISQSRITYSGEGSTRPIASNETRDGRKKNRRVEIVISEAE